MLAILNRIAVPNLSVALAAVHGAPFSRLERHLGLFTTLGTDDVKHLPRSSLAIVVPAATRITALLLPGLPALGATLGVIGEPPASKELLLSNAKGKTGAALYAFQGLVHIAHG